MSAKVRSRARAGTAVLGATAMALAALSGPAHASHHPTATSLRPVASHLPAATTAGRSTWPTYHHDAKRTGVQPRMPAAGALHIQWRLSLDGAVYASPVLANDGVIAATERDTVYFIKSGHIVWQHHLGTPATSGLPCGDINPLGVTGTPVYVPSTNTVYLVAEFASPIRHVLFALNAVTGAIRWSSRIDEPGSDPVVEQQRPALALSHGRIYADMGGLAGDCGDYHGYVVGMNADGSGSPFWYRTPGTQGGIWAAPGPVAEDDGSLLVSVGNGGATSAPYDYSDSVLRLTADGLDRASYFAPSVWPDDNRRDLDLGSNAPTRVHLSSGDYVVIAGKRGVVYLLHNRWLRRVGGAITRLSGCHAYGGSAVSGSVVYLPCTEGDRAVKVGAKSLGFLWTATPAGSPVVGGGAVWSLGPSAGMLYELSPTTGAVRHSISVGRASRFATPALKYDGHVFVPTLDGIVSVAGG